jgi:hypothetical protein
MYCEVEADSVVFSFFLLEYNNEQWLGITLNFDIVIYS